MRYFILSLLLVSACGLIHQEEITPPKIYSNTPKEACSLPSFEKISDKKNVKDSDIDEFIDCLEKNITKAFDQIKGSKENELTYEELRTLDHKGIIKLQFDSEIKWRLFKELFPLFHPKGEYAISKDTFTEIIRLSIKHKKLYLRALKTNWQQEKGVTLWPLLLEIYEAADEWIPILSSHYSLSLHDAMRIGDDILDFEKEIEKRNTLSKEELRDMIKSLWTFKSIFLIDYDQQGITSNLTGKSLNELFKVLLKVLKITKHSQIWFCDKANPTEIPLELKEELKEASDILIQYFENNSFATISEQELSSAIEKADRRTNLYQLSGELVRFSRRLSPKEKRKNGLHPISFVTILKLNQILADEILQSAKAFTKIHYQNYYVLLREALKHPILSTIAGKGNLQYEYKKEGDKSLYSQRLDTTLKWDDAIGLLTVKNIVKELFKTFDPNGIHQGEMPLKGDSELELKETLDLASTFLRFASISTKTKDESEEGSSYQPISVKPKALYKVMGLVGDKWGLDGDNNNRLNGDEFFSIVKLYDLITSQYTIRYPTLGYVKFDCLFYCYDQEVFGRRDAITHLASGYDYSLPWIYQDLLEISPERIESLFHALIGNPGQYPLEVRESHSNEKKKIYHYIDRSSVEPVNAVLIMLDRLMLLSDKDENNIYSWKELDTAVPLVLQAAEQTVNSNLIELDLDAEVKGKVLLYLLAHEFPLTVSKLIIANGSLSKLSLSEKYPEILHWSQTEMTATFKDLAYFIGLKNEKDSSYYLYEAKKRFGQCDFNPKDNQIQGEEEFNCFTQAIMNQMISSLEKILNLPKNIAEEYLNLDKLEALNLSLKLATQSKDKLDKLFEKEIPLTAKNKNILLLLEEIIRRSPENALPLDDFKGFDPRELQRNFPQ